MRIHREERVNPSEVEAHIAALLLGARLPVSSHADTLEDGSTLIRKLYVLEDGSYRAEADVYNGLNRPRTFQAVGPDRRTAIYK